MRYLILIIVMFLTIACKPAKATTITTFDSDPLPTSCSPTPGNYYYCNVGVTGLQATDTILGVSMLYPGTLPAALGGWDENSRTDNHLGVFFSTYPGNSNKFRVLISR